MFTEKLHPLSEEKSRLPDDLRKLALEIAKYPETTMELKRLASRIVQNPEMNQKLQLAIDGKEAIAMNEITRAFFGGIMEAKKAREKAHDVYAHFGNMRHHTLMMAVTPDHPSTQTQTA